MQSELLDNIRWLDLGHKMVLQVRHISFLQGIAEESWINVPVVVPGSKKPAEHKVLTCPGCHKEHQEHWHNCPYCFYVRE